MGKTMSSLGSLVVSLEANIASFTSDMGRAAHQTEQAMQRINHATAVVKNALGTLGIGASVGGFALLVKGAIDAADNLRDMSQKTGIAIEKLNGLGFAAGQAGGNLESMGSAAGKLNKAIAEAAGGAKEPSEAFKAMGINVLDSVGNLKTADVVMAEIADKFAGYTDGPEKVALAMRTLGKAGADMIPLLNDGGDAMRQNIAYAQQYGGVTNELSVASDNFNDTMGKLKVQQDSFFNAMASSVLPILQSVADETLGAAEASDKFSLATNIVRTVLETFVVVGSEVAYAFKTVGTEIGGIAAQLAALADFDMQGFNAISEAMKADAEKARQEHDKFIADILNRQPAKVALSGDAPLVYGSRKAPAPRLPGSGTDGAAAAAQLAKAQLDADLARIKTATDALTSTYANAEKIMEAMRAAGRMDESEYYAAKLAFLNLNSQAQEDELQKEIARLQAEKLTGKEKIDNDKKIAEAQAKLIKVREDAAAGSVVLSIQEVAANEKIAKSYIDATTAAEAYIKTITDRNAREVAGLGKGLKFREEQSGRNQIEDKFTGQRQGLERDLRNNQITQNQFDDYLAVAQRTYERELDLYSTRTEAIDARSADWLTGATESMNNYLDQSRDVASQTEAMFTDAFQGMEDAIADFVKTGKIDFSSLAESILADMVRIQIRAAMAPVTSGLSNWLGGLFGSSSSSMDTGVGSGFDTALWGARAEGGPVLAGGTYLVGEKGPELLKLGSSGGTVIPNNALGGSAVFNLSIIGAPSQPKIETKPNSSGGMDISAIFEQAEGYMSKRISQGVGLAPVLEQQYGVNRAAGLW